MTNLTRKDYKNEYLSELVQFNNFEGIFNYIHENMISIICNTSFERLEKLRGLRQALSLLDEYINIETTSIVNLLDIVDMQIGLVTLSLDNNEIKEKDTNREVIIELKTKNQNPTKQLLAYSKDFDNPILIGITEKTINKKFRLDGIYYFTYEELNIYLK